MKKFSLTQLDNNRLWTPLLIIGIISYIFLLYHYNSTSAFSLLQSDLDGILYQYYFLDKVKYPILHQLWASSMGMILLLIIELLLFAILFNGKKMSRYSNIRALVIFVFVLLLSSFFVHNLSSFWIGQILVFLAMCIFVKKANINLLEMLFLSFLIGIAGLFYAGSFLFVFILLFYSLEQRHWIRYSLIGIFGIATPAYLAISYMWLKYDEWIYFPNIFSSWSWHIDIFPYTYIYILFVATMILGYVYLFIRQFSKTDIFKRLSKFVVVYYFVSLLLFFIEINNQIAVSIITPALSLLFIKNNKI